MSTTRDPWARVARGNIYLIAFFRTDVAVRVLNAGLVAVVRKYWTSPSACFGSSECIFAGPLGPFAFTIILTGRPLPCPILTLSVATVGNAAASQRF